MTDDSSNFSNFSNSSNSSNDNMPNLDRDSRAIGKWDRSTVPDTVSQHTEDTFDRNRFNRDAAMRNKESNDNIEQFNNECLQTTDFVTQESARVISDIDREDIEKMA